MTDREIKLVMGALLHDIGKVVFRAGDGRQHSISGYEFLKDDLHLSDTQLLDCVRYHHGNLLKTAKIQNDALAYIVYIADNIAAATDRRVNDSDEKGYDVKVPLESIFNILNGNHLKAHYSAAPLLDDGNTNMPTEEETVFEKSFYNELINEIKNSLQDLENWKIEYVNSLLSTMEAYLSYIPSSTALHELADISLYDHLKMTAAYASCIEQYLTAEGITDYKEALYKNASAFYEKKAFRLFSMDLSGIQSFIYTIHSEGALSMLRSRSFYLEIVMEHMIDEILEAANLSRANVIYSGGGHCYMLLPDTNKMKDIIKEKQASFNRFFLEQFNVSLYIACASTACSANELKNIPKGSYKELFKSLSNQLSEQKLARYTKDELLELNRRSLQDDRRECKVCKTSAKIKGDRCVFCDAMDKFSKEILYKHFFSISLKEREGAIALPGGKYLISQDEKAVKKSMEEDPYFVRTYGKNKFYTGKSVATKLWVGDYTQKGKTTEDYAKEAEGIDRIAVLRADVDNLGRAFVSGFPEEYTTLSRTAMFSRQLSLFFKHHINYVLSHPKFSLNGKKKERNATIVYSGGDDLFIVGAWDDVIELAIDVRNELNRYSLGTLTLSAGIGIYQPKYPLSVAAEEVAEYEESAKNYPNKNAVTLFEGTYSWEDFITKVIDEKLYELETFLSTSEERGKAFLYRLLELIRTMDDRINLARFAYVLARLEPDDDKDKEQKAAYSQFSKRMYNWVQNEKDRRELVTAIYLYVYLHREGVSE